MTLRVLLALMVVLFWTLPADALPRFASRTGARCQSCHINPSGGEMRRAFGVQYGRETLPVPAWSSGEFAVEDFSNLIGNVLGIGADLRTLYFARQPRTGGATNAFFQMQGDLYLNFTVSKKVSLYLSKGLYSGFQAFALLNLLPASGHVKVGKFIPAYGIRLDDHTAFIRTFTGFSPEIARPELTGIEAGLAPGGLTLMGGVYNASDGFGAASGNTKAYLGRAEYMLALGENVHLNLGGNIFGHALLKTPTAFAPGETQTLWGGFGSLSVGQFTLLGEADWIRSKSAGTTTAKAFVLTVEANYPVVQGVDLKLMYDFLDPDTDFKTGTASRYSAGIEFFPLPGLELRPVYRVVEGDVLNVKHELDVLLHLYF